MSATITPTMRGWFAVLTALAAGCSGGDDSPDAGPVVLDPCGFGDSPSASVDVSERADGFHAGPYARIGAVLRDRPEPPLQSVVAEDGECRSLHVNLGFCDPACESTETCTAADECQPYPRLLSGGTLTIDGLGDSIAVEPEGDFSPGTYLGPTGLSADLFDESDTVRASLEGDAFPALALAARGVAAMDADLTSGGLDLVDGQDAEIAWTAGPDPEACVELVLNGFNQAHGAPLGDVIRCVGPDDGSLVVPRALVEAFPPGETPEVTEGYDWPHSELTRYTRSTRPHDPGPATLVVRSTTYFRLRHTP